MAKKKIRKKKKPEGYVFGRPTEYRSEYCQKMVEYFDRKPYKKVGKRIVVSDFPTFEGFCFKIHISRQTLLDWTDKHKDFLGAYEQCKAVQKDILTQNGLRGNYNCLFAKFVAINATDMRDKTETEHSGTVKLTSISDVIGEVEKSINDD